MSLDPFVGMMFTFHELAVPTQSRDDALNEQMGDIIVDTCCAFDTHQWETGISTNSGEDWKIVEQYDSHEDAVTGHAKWVKTMKENPDTKLKDVGVWEGMGDD